MRMSWYLITLASLVIWVAIGCRPNIPEDGDQVIIAQIGNRKLFENELKQIIHPENSSADSAALANAYIDQWVRDQLLMREAARVFSSDFELEELVEDYREKLLKFKLEEKILEERYDTVVTDLQLQAFYNQHKERFVRDEPLYKCWLVKFPANTEGRATFRRDWNADRTGEIEKFVQKEGVVYELDSENWYTWDHILSWCPSFSEERARSVKNQRKVMDNVEYHLKVLEIIDKGDISPLTFVKMQLKLMILHQRRQDIIASYKQELYEKGLEDNIIKI